MTAPDLSLFLDSAANLVSDIPTQLFELMPNGVAYCKMMRDHQPHDFVFLYTNPAFHTLTGLGTVKGNHVSVIIPGISDSSPELFRICGKISSGGSPEMFEIYIEGLKQWFSVQVFSPKLEHFIATFTVITEFKSVEQNLILNEKRFRGLLEDQTEIICRFKTDGTIIFANDAYCRLFGKSPESLIGQKWQPIAWPEDVPLINEKLKTLSPTNPVVVIENRIITADGVVRWGQFVNRAFFDDDGVLFEMQAVGRDITEQKQAEVLLKQSELRYRTLFENSAEAIFINRNGTLIEQVNKACMHLWLANKPDELVGKNPLALFHTDYHPLIKKRTRQAMRNNEVQPMIEKKIIRLDGSLADVLASAIPFVDSQGPLLFVILLDITSRKQAEAALQESQRKQRDLSKHLELVREEERAHIAREMHDELGSFLNILKLDLSWLDKQLPPGLSDCHEKTLAMLEQVNEGIQTVKKIITDLRPSILDHLGLLAAIEWQVENFRKHTGIHCILTLPDTDLKIESTRSTAIFRIAQETLTNIIAHAKASEFVVDIELSENDLLMTIRDNGVGMTPIQQQSCTGYGIQGMRERALHFGGEFDFNSSPETGTTVVLRMPLQQRTIND